jgi:hypothetical protein
LKEAAGGGFGAGSVDAEEDADTGEVGAAVGAALGTATTGASAGGGGAHAVDRIAGTRKARARAVRGIVGLLLGLTQ